MDTVEKVIYRLPDKQFKFVAHIRELILTAHPEITEKISFNTPFFYCNSWLCYLDLMKQNTLLEIAFINGHQLSDKHKKLVARNRKMVRSLVYETVADFDENIFRETLEEAITINLSKKKISKKQKAKSD
ncbi:MAG TPA: DUF1801 domain-containing protein [Flavipsychrobacter sp.]|nr:DUF1801 domain-containing protein [Flavipsychrobacter sp.]